MHAMGWWIVWPPGSHLLKSRRRAKAKLEGAPGIPGTLGSKARGQRRTRPVLKEGLGKAMPGPGNHVANLLRRASAAGVMNAGLLMMHQARQAEATGS